MDIRAGSETKRTAGNGSPRNETKPPPNETLAHETTRNGISGKREPWKRYETEPARTLYDPKRSETELLQAGNEMKRNDIGPGHMDHMTHGPGPYGPIWAHMGPYGSIWTDVGK